MPILMTAIRDSNDTRDFTYTPPIVTVPTSIDRNRFPLHILDQGQEGACTGFGLAASIYAVTQLSRKAGSKVSPWMLYYYAKDYDEFPGRNYEGSSCRGALKAWSKQGALPETAWGEDRKTAITAAESNLAAQVPVGVYARIEHKNIAHMHIAIATLGAVYCSASVHDGWMEPVNGTINWNNDAVKGGHAFAIIGYNERGFLVQNSWNESWGDAGTAIWLYEDYLKNIYDAWAIAVGAPTPL